MGPEGTYGIFWEHKCPEASEFASGGAGKETGLLEAQVGQSPNTYGGGN